MPDPMEYESEAEWMKVCVPKMIDEGREQDQAVAACLGMWEAIRIASRLTIPSSPMAGR